MDYKNNAYLYDKEKVIFDFPRLYEPHDLRLVEDLKNGMLLSQKYEPVRKVFSPPIIIIFSNQAPNLAMLSMDRWRIMSINQTEDDITIQKEWMIMVRNDN